MKEFGEEYLFELPENIEVAESIVLPKNIYINDQCENPYIFEIKNDKSFVMYLPDKYNVLEMIEQYTKGENVFEEPKLKVEEQKGRNELKNISISKKGKYMTLCYQLRSNNKKINEYNTLPTVEFDYNIELVRLNNKVIEWHGIETSFLYH